MDKMGKWDRTGFCRSMRKRASAVHGNIGEEGSVFRALSSCRWGAQHWPPGGLRTRAPWWWNREAAWTCQKNIKAKSGVLWFTNELIKAWGLALKHWVGTFDTEKLFASQPAVMGAAGGIGSLGRRSMVAFEGTGVRYSCTVRSLLASHPCPPVPVNHQGSTWEVLHLHLEGKGRGQSAFCLFHFTHAHR